MLKKKISRRQPKRKGVKCTECENAIFDERWGEYKCKARCIRIANLVLYHGCDFFIAKTEKK